jgi:hypothetical protein
MELDSLKSCHEVDDEKESREDSKSLFDILLGPEGGGSSKSHQWSLNDESSHRGSRGNEYFWDSMSEGNVKSFTGEMNSDPNKKIPICDQDTETG